MRVEGKMKIEKLINYTHLIPEIAQLKFDHYRRFAPEIQLIDVQKNLEKDLVETRSPIALVVIENNSYVGSISLRINDMESYSHLTPWLGGLFVHPSMRKKGIGSLLISKIIQLAKDLGYAKLYLYTSDKADWYSKLGWKTVEHTLLKNSPVTIMEFRIL